VCQPALPQASRMLNKFRSCTVICFVACPFLCIPFEAIAQYNTPNTDPVTEDDCEIIAQVTTTHSTSPLSFASFGAACDWPTLGLNVPTTTATEGWRTFFDRPNYNNDREEASVSYSDSYHGTNGMLGAHEFRCTFKKQSGHWHIVRCTQGIIVN
jgi:hypothetical protein